LKYAYSAFPKNADHNASLHKTQVDHSIHRKGKTKRLGHGTKHKTTQKRIYETECIKMRNDRNPKIQTLLYFFLCLYEVEKYHKSDQRSVIH